jgi:hypothetical protein
MAKQGNGGGLKYKRYVDRRQDFPDLISAGYAVKDDAGILFYERGFFGIMWKENNIRKVKDLKNW